MTDSSSFSSLFALVDSHLSKTQVQDDGDNTGSASINIPSLRGMSETHLRTPLRLPRFSTSESPISSILSTQLANMFKAQELKKQQDLEQEKLQEEMKRIKLEEDNCVIDLMKAVQRPGQSLPRFQEPLSSGSSHESLLDTSEFVVPPKEEELLPLKTDMRYILKQKIKRAKCSAFGKVLTSRLRPVAAPYLLEIIDSSVERFDFATKSPCDILMEKRRRPHLYSQSEDHS